MKLKSVYLILWSVKFVVSEVGKSKSISLMDLENSIFDQCVLCNADTIENSIQNYNLSSLYNGKLAPFKLASCYYD